MKKFRMELEVPYFACDKDNTMNPSSILEYLGEASSSHSDHLKVGFKELQKEGYGWVLNRWKLKIIRYPRAKDKIIIETWTSRVYKFYANREFVIYDDSGEKVAMGTTIWIFINTDRKRPVRIPEDLKNKYKMIEEFVFDEFYKFNDLENSKFKVDFSIRKSDIDYNNHVNNVKYLDWIIEGIPEEVYNNYKLEELELLYKQEILYGQRIVCRFDEKHITDESITFLHEINTKENIKTNAYGKTKWRRIEKI